MESLPSKTCTKCGEIKTIDEYYKDNRGTHKGRRSSCKDCSNLRDKKYREANRDAALERSKKYYKENRAAELERNKKYYKNTREAQLKYRKKHRKENINYYKKYREANRDALLKNMREYQKNNLDKYREAARRRLARKKGNGVQKYTEAQVLETYGSACHLCEREIDLTAPRRVGASGWEDGLHIDHLIPISKGGPDMLENVKPSHARCNVSKGDRL